MESMDEWISIHPRGTLFSGLWSTLPLSPICEACSSYFLTTLLAISMNMRKNAASRGVMRAKDLSQTYLWFTQWDYEHRNSNRIADSSRPRKRKRTSSML